LPSIILIRAEAALYGAPGNAETFFQAGITASMQAAGVSASNITSYITANGRLTGTDNQKLEKIIKEKIHCKLWCLIGALD